jgi:hypothetical protein
LPRSFAIFRDTLFRDTLGAFTVNSAIFEAFEQHHRYRFRLSGNDFLNCV